MDRNELTMAIAGALVAAFLLGWVARWLFGRLNAARGPRNAARTANIAAQLHAEEDARRAAEARLARVEAEASQRIVELGAELDATRTSLARAEAQAEVVRAAWREARGQG